MRKINARELWQKILETRMQTGEPYLVFIDTVNKNMAKHQKNKGLKVRTSNLCSEIMLHTGKITWEKREQQFVVYLLLI